MKQLFCRNHRPASATFSALGRAVWDETGCGMGCRSAIAVLSVLSVEPYGMKLSRNPVSISKVVISFSALGRAVWDETTKLSLLFLIC